MKVVAKGGDIRNQSQSAGANWIRVLQSANVEFPPNFFIDNDVSPAAEIQGNICQKGKHKCQP